MKIIIGAAVLASLTFVAGNLQAQETNLITINATAELQGSTITNSFMGTNVLIATFKPPTVLTLDTKQILEFLAVDENAEGNYGATTFPSGAKLVEINSSSSSDYQVLGREDNFLVDVSDILHFAHSTNQVFIGKHNFETGLNEPTVSTKQIDHFYFDDTAISGGVGINFWMSGLATRTITDTTPNKEGVFKETNLREAPIVMGDGTFLGAAFVITGSLNQRSSGTYIY